jgi:ADP-ribosyl cyclase
MAPKFVRLLSFLFFSTAGADATSTASKPTTSEPQNTFLKEILLGRCYENLPNQSPEGGSSMCPVVVDSFLGAIAGQLDENIQSDAFFMYMGWTSYEVKKDTALLVWPPSYALDMTWNSDYILPETSASGGMLKGLVFCGPDKRMNCPTEYWNGGSSAMVSFWHAVYSDFASKAQGRVRMMVLEKDLKTVPSLWDESVVTGLDAGTVSSVEVMAVNCDASGVSALVESIQNLSIECSCKEIAEAGISEISSVCGIEDLLQTDTKATANDEPSDTTMAPAPIVDCQCSDSVYMYLFWAILLLGLAASYAMWSVWHYLPEYQRVPNVEQELLGNGNRNGEGFPKQ